MADPKPQNEETQKEGEGFQETFMSHLFELRDRVVKSAIAVIIVFISLFIGRLISFIFLQSRCWMHYPRAAR